MLLRQTAATSAPIPSAAQTKQAANLLEDIFSSPQHTSNGTTSPGGGGGGGGALIDEDFADFNPRAEETPPKQAPSGVAGDFGDFASAFGKDSKAPPKT